jgi:uncharacterized protein YndB with AHSA1/START domain
MSQSLVIENNIDINAPASRVWQILTNPQETKKYMFGCEAISEWKVGRPLEWKGIFGGKEVVAVKGEILDILMGKFLSYTTFDPNGSIPDIPENYLKVTYTLNESRGHTQLKVTQGDYSRVQDGQKRYEDSTSGGGWMSILTEVKRIAEQS